MAEKFLSIIVPIYNEDAVAASSLPPIFNLPINKEVIVINDGSTDRTEEILQSLQKQYSFKLINEITNQGKGAAVRKGFNEAKGDYVVIYDADAEYRPEDISRLFESASRQEEMTAIYGSRFLNNRCFSFHYLVNQFLTKMTNWLFKSRLTDMETCLKMIPKSALTRIKLQGRRFEIEPEITAQLLKNGYQILEIPISYERRGYNEGKKIKPRDGLLAIKTLVAEKLFRKG